MLLLVVTLVHHKSWSDLEMNILFARKGDVNPEEVIFLSSFIPGEAAW